MKRVHPQDEHRGTEDPREGRLDDLRLARRAQEDRAAADELLRRLGPRVQKTVRFLVGSDTELEDLIHGCLLAVLENLGNYRGTGPIEAWAGQLTYRVLMRQLKRKRRGERTHNFVPEEVGEVGVTPEQLNVEQRTSEVLGAHLSRITEKRRRALILRLMYGYSVAEVAAITESPVNTVRDRIRVGLKELRKSIAADAEAMELFGGKKGD